MKSLSARSNTRRSAESTVLPLSGKIASLMILLSIPSLVFFGMLTLPALLFPSPQQHAYFHFAREINHDPSRWLAYSMAAICVLVALAVPALDSRSPKLSSLRWH